MPRGSIAAGSSHVCATAAGRVACWGHADAGQLGPAIDADQPRPVLIDGLDDIAGVSAGPRGSCAWSKRGAVWCWGTFGASRQAVTRVPGIDDAAQVTVEDGLACALRRDGRVACWATDACTSPSPGSPPSTRLRRGSDPPDEVACGLHEIDQVAGATEVAIAGWHGCALTAEAVWCWLGNRGRPFALPHSAGATSIAGARQRRLYSSTGFADQENIFVLHGGTIAGRTLNTRGAPDLAPFHAGPGAIRISAGVDRVCAIGSAVTCSIEGGKREEHALAAVDLDVGARARCVRTAGDRIACWGATGLLGDGGLDEIEVPVEVSGITDGVQLAADDGTACVRRANGRVACWGVRYSGEVQAVPADAGIERAVDLVVGFAHACVLRDDGTTACWGRDNAAPSLSLEDMPPTAIPSLAGAVRLSADTWSTCAIHADRRVVCHGAAHRMMRLPARAAELWHSGDIACQRRPDRTVVCESTFHGALELGADVARLAIVYDTACAVRTSGAVDCYGDYLRVSRRIPGIADAVAIAGGGIGDRTCVVRAGGTVACWSDRGRETGKPTAVRPVPHLADAVDIAAGWSYACALRRGGRVACWGRPDHLGDGSRSERAVPVVLPQL